MCVRLAVKEILMRDDERAGREAVIHAAAYRLVAERGYADTSMLAIAKAARASNETLYRWYGDKKGLFRSMVEANARDSLELLTSRMDDTSDPLQRLHELAPVLLGMLVSERAVALNRAAASDVSGELGAALAQGGRDSVFPLLVETMARAVDSGALAAASPEQAAQWYLSLLIGDLQVRRVNRSLGEPDRNFIDQQSRAAMQAFVALCGASVKSPGVSSA